MGEAKYTRDKKTGAVILSDPRLINDFMEKRTVHEQIESLKTEIDTLKKQVNRLNELMQQIVKSE